MKIKEKIRTIPDHPKKGIMFRDITTLLKDREGFKNTVKTFVGWYKDKKIDIVCGIESRGFIIGDVIAQQLGLGFVPIRKKGKLPAAVEREEYELEYWMDTIEIYKDIIKEGDKVLLVDDLLATGGTSLAAARLIERIGSKVIECAIIIDLPEVGGRKRLKMAGYPMFYLCEFEGE